MSLMNEPEDLNHALELREAQRVWINRKILTISQIEDDYEKTALREMLLQKQAYIIELDKYIQDYVDPQTLAADVVESNEFEMKTKVATMRLATQTIPDQRDITLPQPAATPKLPELNIPPYDGDPLTFRNFWDLFDVLINQNQSISDLQKYTYLVSLLRKEALDAVSGVRRCAENYPSVIQILFSRFDKPQLIRQKHYNNLTNLPKLQTDTKTKEMRQHYEYIRSNVTSLKTLDGDISGYAQMLIPKITSSLPFSLQTKVVEKTSVNYSLDALMEAFNHHINIREMCNSVSGDTRQGPSTSARANVFHVRVEDRGKCIFCNSSDHSAVQCTKMTQSERYTFIKNEHRCFNCFSSKHPVNKCVSSYRCRKCKGKHHTAICRKTSQNASQD